MSVSVTLLYGGLNAALVGLLGLWVSLRRIQLRVFGVASVPHALQRPIRAHGNAAEWVPLALVLLLVLELSGGVSSRALHLLGGGLLGARLLHAAGMLGLKPLSTVGATLTYLLMAALCGWALVLHFAAGPA